MHMAQSTTLPDRTGLFCINPHGVDFSRHEAFSDDPAAHCVTRPRDGAVDLRDLGARSGGEARTAEAEFAEALYKVETIRVPDDPASAQPLAVGGAPVRQLDTQRFGAGGGDFRCLNG